MRYVSLDQAVLSEEAIPNSSYEPPGTKASEIRFSPTAYVWRCPMSIPRREFLYGTHLIRGFLSVSVAPGGVGKSSLELVEAVVMAAGKALLGIKPRRALRVWYVNLEDPREEIERRIAAICLHYQIDPKSLGERLFFDGREIEIILAEQSRGGVKLAVPVEAALASALRAGDFDVLVMDPFVSTHRVTENDNGAIDAVAKTFGRIAGSANCAVELVHHVRKTGGAEITAEDGRGASALIAAARSVRVLNPMSEKEAETSGVGEQRRFYFRADVGKSNLAPPSTKATWFKLESVPLGNGTPGASFDDGDHVGVVASWKWPDAFEGITTSDLRKVQEKVAGGRWRENAQAKEWVGRAVAEALFLDADDKTDAAKIKLLLKIWTANGMFVVTESKDERHELRKYVEVGMLAND